jgi:mono/diheme cytochrome c family protein
MKSSRSPLIVLLTVLLLSGGLLFGCISTEPAGRPPTAAPTATSPSTAATPAEGEDIPPGVVPVQATQKEPPSEAQDIYASYCAVCHGEAGEGTPSAVPLNTSEVQSRAQDELARTIREGVAGTGMAGWERVVSPEEVQDLVAFIKQLDEAEAAGTPQPRPTATPIDPTDQDAMLRLGQDRYATSCASCHGEDGIGGFGPAINSQQFLTRHSDAMIRDAIVSGGWRPDSAMPAFGEHLKTTEVEALVQFIRAWEPDAPYVDDPRGTSLIARGYGQGMGQGQGQGPGQGQGQGRGPGMGQGRGPGMGQGRGPGMGQGRGPGMGQGMGSSSLAQNATRVSYQGEVVQVDGTLLTLETDEGETVQAMLGPRWYWWEQGIALDVGHQVIVEGFDMPDFYLVVSQIENETTDETYQARTTEGFPLWQGGGGMVSPTPTP